MRALRWGIAGALVIVLAVLAAPFVVPLRQWMPQLSELASMRLGQRVALADLQLSLWPKPGAIARGVRIGKSNEIVIDEVRLSLAPQTLLDDVPVIDEIRARTVSLNEAGLAIITGLTRRAGIFGKTGRMAHCPRRVRGRRPGTPDAAPAAVRSDARFRRR